MTGEENNAAAMFLRRQKVFQAGGANQPLKRLEIRLGEVTEDRQQAAEILKTAAHQLSAFSLGNLREGQGQVPLRSPGQSREKSTQTAERSSQSHLSRQRQSSEKTEEEPRQPELDIDLDVSLSGHRLIEKKRVV